MPRFDLQSLHHDNKKKRIYVIPSNINELTYNKNYHSRLILFTLRGNVNKIQNTRNETRHMSEWSHGLG